jgi:flagellar biosynthesis GTPase FlhF
MQVNYWQCWCFALSGARQYVSETSTKPGLLRRTLRRLGAQIIVSAFVLIDIGGLGFGLVASIWLAPWVAINLTALVFGSLSWSEDRRIQRESATATRRQGEKVRGVLEELQRKAKRQQQEAERRQREKDDEREAQKRLQATLRQAQEQLKEAELRRYQEEKERETQRQQSEQAERLRQAEQQQREAEQRRRQAEEERKAQKKRRREHRRVATQFTSDWWIVLGVAPSASKDEIVRKYRHKIKQCHPDRLGRLAPELLQLAEEQAKALNAAYENAMRTRRHAIPDAAAA